MVGTVGNKGLNAHRYERRTSVRRFCFVLCIREVTRIPLGYVPSLAPELGTALFSAA